MATGLVALLDDIAGITKLAAASLDDVGAAAGKAGAKAAGVVVDDTAVTPRYVTGFTPDRELPIIAKIARGSLFNKLVILLPAAIFLSALLPWAITPLLMLGGAYLCFEGAEKLIELVLPHAEGAETHLALESAELEQQKVAGAVRTDFILSAEIMAIALAEVAGQTLVLQAVTLAVVALAITAAVYGVVALIVKMDDIGLHLAQGGTGAGRALGRLLVRAMPVVMQALSGIGIAAMIWVGGQIVLHGLHDYHLTPLPEWVEQAAHAAGAAVPAAQGAVDWVVNAALSGLFGLVLGGLIAGALHLVPKREPAHG
jgi:predicted DNA repair protein MutK